MLVFGTYCLSDLSVSVQVGYPGFINSYYEKWKKF